MISKEFNINSVVSLKTFMIYKISSNQYHKKFILLIVKDKKYRAKIHSENILILHQPKKDP